MVVCNTHKILPISVGVFSVFLALLALGCPVTASENTTADVNIESSITVTVPSTPITLNLDPSTTASSSGNLTISVGTNNSTGYSVVMTSQSGTTNLVNTADSTKVIETLASGTYSSPADFPANHWGYKKDSGSYQPFATNTTIMQSNTTANVDTTTLSFGTKVDYLQASGTYNTTLVFNTTVNPQINYMQDMTPGLCTTTPTTVVDRRDEEAYIVQRLADGNCWLLENLRLDISDPAVQAKLTSTTTNATDTTLGYLKNGGGSSPYATNGVIARTADGGSWANDYANPYIATKFKDTTQNGQDSSPAAKIGIYYNYCAATAGSYCYASNSGTGNASQDICPAGWRMPTGGASGEYQALANAYNSSAASFEAALKTPLSGYFYSNTDGNRGTYGQFWSSTYYGGSYMYNLATGPTTIYPQSNHTRNYGFSVRCILKDSRTVSDITYMQDVNPQILSKMSNGDAATLTDSRDNQSYTVKKINGMVWMTRNLAIGCDGTGSTYGSGYSQKTLKTTDSNVSSDDFSTSTTSLNTGTSYDVAKQTCSSDYGAWYNYAAVSAGTIGSSNTTEAASSLCPKGWRLPTHTENTAVVSYKNDFNPVIGGYTNGGNPNYTSYGFWWSSTANGADSRHVIRWTSSTSALENGASMETRTLGFYIRCVAK